jgi:outer membrane lipoprotein-sorting protein
MRRIATSCLLLLLSASLVYSQTAQTTSPQQILDKMVSVYASCNSYADEGRVETIFFQNSGRTWTAVKPFSTAFVRPSRFRFEFENTDTNRGSHYVVWRDETSIKSWWTIKPEVRMWEGLGFALGAAAGVSSLSSLNVPSMLMQDLRATDRLGSLSGLKLAGEESFANKSAYRIEGKDRRDSLLTIWIDKERFVLLKIYETRKFEDFHTEQTTTYQPQVNIEISPDKLAFKP